MDFFIPAYFRERIIIPGKPRVSFLKNNSDSIVVGIKFDNDSAGKYPALFSINSIQLFTLSNHIKTVDDLMLTDPSAAMLRQELIDKVVSDGRGFVM